MPEYGVTDSRVTILRDMANVHRIRQWPIENLSDIGNDLPKAKTVADNEQTSYPAHYNSL